jgi:ABC-2 type transport system permease protein
MSILSRISLVALIRKEFIQATRDKRLLAMLLFAPVMQTIIFGYAANLEFNHADTVLVDQDHTEESRSFAYGLAADGTFSADNVSSVERAEQAIQEGRAAVAIIIPRGYSDDLLAGSTPHVQILLDGSDPSRGVAAGTAAELYVARRAQEVSRARPASAQPPRISQIVLESRLLYNPGLKSRLFMVPGTAASILLIVTTIITAMGLSREREVGTMEQLLVTPITPITLMVGKTIPYAIFGLIDMTLILIAGNLLFEVPLRGDLLVIFVASLAYLTATLGIGLLISTVARTQQQALMGGFFFILPAILLSGFMTPIDAMPSWIPPLTYLNPVRYFVEIVRNVLLRGATFGDVARPLGLLGLLGLSVLLFAAKRFRRTLA